MMKKSMKNLLLGAGAAIAGIWVYSILKKPEEPMIRSNEAAHNETPSRASTSAQEYVEHRRELLRKKTAAKAAAQETTAQEAAAIASDQDETIVAPAVENVAEILEPSAAAELAEKDVDSINHAPEEHSEHITEADEE